jgi:LEA14-like dessication related protein
MTWTRRPRASRSEIGTTPASRRRWGRVALGMLGVSLVAGCATLGRATFAEPTVKLQDVRVVGLGIDGGNLDIVLSVYNPNRFSLDATRMTYRVDVDSVQLGNGALDSRFVVPKGDTSLVRLPIRFTYRGLGEAGRQILSTGTVNYRVRGDFTVVTPLGNFTRPYDQSGRFNTVTGRGG